MNSEYLGICRVYLSDKKKRLQVTSPLKYNPTCVHVTTYSADTVTTYSAGIVFLQAINNIVKLEHTLRQMYLKSRLRNCYILRFAENEVYYSFIRFCTITILMCSKYNKTDRQINLRWHYGTVVAFQACHMLHRGTACRRTDVHRLANRHHFATYLPDQYVARLSDSLITNSKIIIFYKQVGIAATNRALDGFWRVRSHGYIVARRRGHKRGARYL